MNDLRNAILELMRDMDDGKRDDPRRDALLTRILGAQALAVQPFAKLCARQGERVERTRPADFPAVPTDVYKYARVASHEPGLDVRVFRTSGTTQQVRGAQHLPALDLYDTAAKSAARYALFSDVQRMRLIFLAPSEARAPESSLSHMLSRFDTWFGDGRSTFCLEHDVIDVALLRQSLQAAVAEDVPVALLGTSFAFVHAEEALGHFRVTLPQGSRIMQTGGFKGKSREFSPDEMREMLSARYGVPEAMIIAEYGMTELSSQLYETPLRDAIHGVESPRRLWYPGWMRCEVVDPETLAPVANGEEGILRIEDCANLYTAAAIQTADRARRVEDGIVVLGRVAGATPRGCSLAMDAVLDKGQSEAP